MTVMNVVHMRVKPGKEAEYIQIHRDMDRNQMQGLQRFSLVRAGERDFIVVGEWDSMAAMAAARPAMIGNLDKLRPILEDLGGGRGVTEPWSGEVALTL
jgi:quinol monooxygenase YgiN